MVTAEPRLSDQAQGKRAACFCLKWPYTRCSNEDPAKSGLEPKRIFTVEGGFS